MNTFVFMSLMTLGNILAVPPEPVTISIDSDAIIAGFFQGANIIFGLAGLLALIALPYGLQFALNLVSGLFSKLGGIRF